MIFLQVPFEDFLDWRQFSMKWTQENITEGIEYALRRFSYPDLSRMKAEVDNHRCWFDYSLRADPNCSPYQAIMRILEKKLRIKPFAHNLGGDPFWGPPGTPSLWTYLDPSLREDLKRSEFE